MKKYKQLNVVKLTWVITLCLGFFSHADAQDKGFPADANVANVQNWGAVGDGVTDDTAAIQQAIWDTCGRQYSMKTLYFPPGTYLVSDTLRWERGGAGGGFSVYFAMSGAGKDRAIIKLADNAVGFDNPAQPKPLLDCQPDSGNTNNTAFRKYLWDLTLDTGSGNPGAIGVDYIASNIGSIKNVKVVSGDGQGVWGMDFTLGWPGPFLVKDCEIDGFEVGIKVGTGQYSQTYENIVLKNQSQAGIETQGNALFIRGLTSTNSVPAVRTTGANALVTLVESDLTGGSASRSAIEIASGTGLYARNVTTSGYQSAILDDTTIVSGIDVSEWNSFGTEKLFASAPDASLDLEVRETPDYLNFDFNDWEKVDTSVVNNSSAIQAAMDSGKPVVYFPEKNNSQLSSNFNWYRMNTKVTIPASVQKVYFMGQPIFTDPSWDGSAHTFEILGDENDPPLIIERADTWYQFPAGTTQFLHTGGREVVFRSCSGHYETGPNAGDVYFEDFTGGGAKDSNGDQLAMEFQPGQKAWARQFNLEDLGQSPFPLFRNNGADVWILGMKTEGATSIADMIGDGKTEILGGFYYPVQPVAPTLPLFTVTDADFFIGGYLVQGNYDIQVQETRGGVTETLFKSDVPGRNGGSGGATKMSAFASDRAVIITPDHYWSFEGDPADQVGGAGGRLANGATFSGLGFVGSSLLLDGSNDEVRINDSSLKDQFDEITVVAWVNPDSVTGSRMIYEEGGDVDGFALHIRDGNLEASVRAGGIQQLLTHTASVPTGVWSMITVVYDNGLLKAYVDGGVEETSNTGFTTIPYHSNFACIGGAAGKSAISGADNFEGRIDEVLIFNEALSAGEVQDVYDQY